MAVGCTLVDRLRAECLLRLLLARLVGLYGRILRNTHKISIRERIGVALRQLFGDIGAKRQRAIAGASSQKRSALPRLNPPQEPIPVRFLKFTRHIKQTNERV